MKTETKYDLTYLSLGAGVQSTALLVCSALGLKGVPKVDCAIFADTQGEISDTYQQVEFLKNWAKPYGIPVYIETRGSLEKSALNGAEHRNNHNFISIPAYTEGDEQEGLLLRQCTREFKVEVINQAVRKLLGLKKGERAAGKFKALCLIGISLDEVMRMKPSYLSWIEHKWPLIDARMTRRDCLALLREHGIPEPVKSACYFCPYHDNRYWSWLRKERKEFFEKAVHFDRSIRSMTKAGVKRKIYLHRSCKPLDQVDFDAPKEPGQLELFASECEGICGV